MSDEYILGVLDSQAIKTMPRLAVIEESGNSSYLLQELRNRVPTYMTSNLKEFRIALSRQDREGLVSVDIRELPAEDLAVLAQCLAESTIPVAAIYVMTEAQFSLFKDVKFDFVTR